VSLDDAPHAGSFVYTHLGLSLFYRLTFQLEPHPNELSQAPRSTRFRPAAPSIIASSGGLNQGALNLRCRTLVGQQRGRYVLFYWVVLRLMRISRASSAN
jgi:hypothetical protein